MATGTITVEGKEYPAHQLTPDLLEAIRNLVQAEARKAWNPFVELAAKVSVLPFALQVVAVRAFVQRVDFSAIPADVVADVRASLHVIQATAYAVTGIPDLVTDANADEVCLQLIPFIEQPVTVSSLAEVNAMRVAAGKPPIGG